MASVLPPQTCERLLSHNSTRCPPECGCRESDSPTIRSLSRPRPNVPTTKRYAATTNLPVVAGTPSRPGTPMHRRRPKSRTRSPSGEVSPPPHSPWGPTALDRIAPRRTVITRTALRRTVTDRATFPRTARSRTLPPSPTTSSPNGTALRPSTLSRTRSPRSAM
jgi:hypothetical protein